MIVAVPLGISFLNGPLETPELTYLWVVAAVAARFLPIAAAFDASILRFLAVTMLVVAALGVAATFFFGSDAVAATAVAIGYMLLAFVAWGNWSTRSPPRTEPPAPRID